MVDFSLSEELQKIRDMTREFARGRRSTVAGS
jgi:hypothetical protein